MQEKKYEITEAQRNQVINALSESPHKFVGGVINLLIGLAEAKIEEKIETAHEKNAG